MSLCFPSSKKWVSVVIGLVLAAPLAAQNASTNFFTYFPDSAFATIIAEYCLKQPEETTTPTELANIKGYVAAYGTVANLTGIGFLRGIDSFGCHKNEVTVLPAEIGQLTQLTYLNLSKAYGISTLPPEIGQLRQLKVLYMALTELKEVPKEIGLLTNLVELGLCCNALTVLPKEIGLLKQLKILDIHSNNIAVLPNEVVQLTQLQSLNISYCALKKLPDNIGNLTQLEYLNAFGNDLRVLPKSITKMTRLRYLNVYDNFKLSESYKAYLPKSLKKGR